MTRLERARVIAEKWPQTKSCKCFHCKRKLTQHERPLVTAEDLAQDDGTGRPSRWLWALWMERGSMLHIQRHGCRPPEWLASTSGPYAGGEIYSGATAAAAVFSALAALAKEQG